MNGDAPDEYALADEPESEDPNEDDQPQAPKSQAPRAPEQPLPRMWKTEPDDDPDARPSRRRRGAKSTETAKPSRVGDGGGDDPGEKKALVEETPVFDTYEARQRARVITSALLVGIVGLGLYLGYQMFPKSPFPDDVPTDEAAMAQGPVEPLLPDLDVEARAMYLRAREAAKDGRTDEAVALLENLVKSYKNTKTAVEARDALKRPSQNLPMFLDRPTVKADAPPAPAPEPPAPPPPVVVARAPDVEVKGNATLVLPTNPAEASPPGESAATPPTVPAEKPVALGHRLPAGFAAKTESGVDPSGWPLVIVGDRDGAPMVFIPGGVFTMGDDRDATFASPEHKVNLAGYYLDQHEVTVRQFRLFLAETNYRGRPPGNWSTTDAAGKPPTENQPIVMVNADDAKAYAEWAGKRLPTEAQWELAARSNDGRVFPWGNEPARYARPRAPRQIDAVMSFPEDRSAFGVFDMGGNVYEWTADSFDPGYYRTLAGRVVDNPVGARPRLGKNDLVVKGGKSGAGSAREPMVADKRLTYLGFRCALEIENPPFTPTPAPEPTAPESIPPPANRRPAPVNVAPPPVPF